MLEVCVVTLPVGDALCELCIAGQYFARALHFYGFKSQAEVREVCVGLLQLRFKELDAGLKENDALGGSLGASDEKFVDVLGSVSNLPVPFYCKGLLTSDSSCRALRLVTSVSSSALSFSASEAILKESTAGFLTTS